MTRLSADDKRLAEIDAELTAIEQAEEAARGRGAAHGFLFRRDNAPNYHALLREQDEIKAQIARQREGAVA